MFTKDFLLDVRRLALRRKTWYSALDALERGILSISAHIIDEVKSNLLQVQLLKIIDKLRNASKSAFIKHVEDFGIMRAMKIRDQAGVFGYNHVDELLQDFGFVRYIAFLDYYQPIGWRIRSTS